MEKYKSTNSMFKPTHIVLHSPSEHTINGNYMDIELQIHHIGPPGNHTFRKAIVSVMFSTEYADASISTDQNQTI